MYHCPMDRNLVSTMSKSTLKFNAKMDGTTRRNGGSYLIDLNVVFPVGKFDFALLDQEVTANWIGKTACQLMVSG